MSVIAGVFGALPPHRYSQSEITDQFVEIAGLKEHEEIVVVGLRAAPEVAVCTPARRSTAATWFSPWISTRR